MFPSHQHSYNGHLCHHPLFPSKPLSELISDCSRAAELVEQSRKAWNRSAPPSLCISRCQAGISHSGNRQKLWHQEHWHFFSLKVVHLRGTEVAGLYWDGLCWRQEWAAQWGGEGSRASHRNSSVPGCSPGKLNPELETEDKTLP